MIEPEYELAKKLSQPYRLIKILITVNYLNHLLLIKPLNYSRRD